MSTSKKPASERARTYRLSYWVDETVPALDDLLVGRGIDAEAFSVWLGPKLGDYRGSLSIKKAVPSRGEEFKVLTEVGKQLQCTLGCLQPSHIPPRAMAKLMDLGLKAGHNIFELRESTRTAVIELLAIIEAAKTDLAKQPAAPGRKKLFDRDELAAAIVEQLRKISSMPAQAAQSLTTDILIRCRVASPDDLARPVRRVKGHK